MKLTINSVIVALVAISSAEGFAPQLNNNIRSLSSLQAEIGDTGVAFENVAREWRCKVRFALQLVLGCVQFQHNVSPSSRVMRWMV